MSNHIIHQPSFGQQFFQKETKVKLIRLFCLVLVSLFIVVGCKKRPAGNTTAALFRAAREGSIKQIKSLVSNGADIDATDRNERTPLHWAVYHRHKNVAELLIIKGANIDAKNSQGRTPLLSAVSRGHREVVNLLLVNGANVNAKDNDDRTPLSLAKDKGYDKIVELLRMHGAKE